MARTTQLSKEKQQSIITLRHASQSIWKISRKYQEYQEFIHKCSHKNHQTHDETGFHVKILLLLLKRINSLVTRLRIHKLTASQIKAHINGSQSSNSRHISTSTVEKRIRESGCHCRIAAKKPLLRKNNQKKRSAWDKKHKELTLDQWKSVIWSHESNFENFGSTLRVFVGHRKGEWMVVYMCGSHHEAWRRECDCVGVLCLWHCWWFIQNSRHT